MALGISDVSVLFSLFVFPSLYMCIRDRDTPTLLRSSYHGFNDLIRIPKLINSINKNYNFYLRYYGGNIFPTEIVLIAKKKKKS